MFEVPAWSMINNPYAYQYNGQESLLITVGDSWTYGDSLGKTKVRNGVDDTEYRLNSVFGAQLATLLKSNWINLALPGGSNEWMLNNLELLLPTIKEKKVICIITLTESGRHGELRLIDRALPTQQAVLEKILAHTYSRITDLQTRYPGVVFVTAHNFTDALDTVLEPTPRSWLEVMFASKRIQNGTHVVVSDYIEQMNYEKRFPDVLDIITKAQHRINIMDHCIFCNKEDTRHPTEQGHTIWAEYLKGFIDYNTLWNNQ